MVAQGRKEIIAQVCALASAATSLVGMQGLVSIMRVYTLPYLEFQSIILIIVTVSGKGKRKSVMMFTENGIHILWLVPYILDKSLGKLVFDHFLMELLIIWVSHYGLIRQPSGW